MKTIEDFKVDQEVRVMSPTRKHIRVKVASVDPIRELVRVTTFAPDSEPLGGPAWVHPSMLEHVSQ